MPTWCFLREGEFEATSLLLQAVWESFLRFGTKKTPKTSKNGPILN